MADKSSVTEPTSKQAAKAELKKLREQQKVDKKKRKTNKKAKGEGFFARIKQVFTMTRAHDPNIVWWMLLAALVTFAVAFVLVTLLLNWITGLLVATPFALLAAMIVMNRRAEKAAFARIEGRPGAAAAALNTLRRGWVVSEEPIAMDAKTQDAVFRVVGKPGVILVTEGPPARVKKMVEKTRKRLRPVLRNEVPIVVVQSGRAGNHQVPLPKLTKHLKKLDKKLTKHEVHEIERRLSALPISQPPIPKGVDPFRSRPDRKALRG
ncbi:DUF4191 domain-containing protein [Garicola koreensis]|uniref:Putative outer membrane lipoprotein n=1 Tax=Garicola koreensis TaxID=1262554 RepID=A0A7W5Y056_9MICC|nr:DUF4191 domain-containing protein [Garicola koreensis]MBB3666893.1 putative outer membrane lipoprotein [Garicola koreensis]